MKNAPLIANLPKWRVRFFLVPGWRGVTNFQAPTSKLQGKTKPQAPKPAPGFATMLIEVWDFSGAWSLEFGCSSPHA
jgi:hypothetical protein